jgi:hypothetical protein
MAETEALRITRKWRMYLQDEKVGCAFGGPPRQRSFPVKNCSSAASRYEEGL